MRNLIAAAVLSLTMGVAALAEPAPTTTQPTPPPVAQQPQTTVKKDQTPAQPAPVKEKKPVDLNFRSF